jgi:hypothetical protein
MVTRCQVSQCALVRRQAIALTVERAAADVSDEAEPIQILQQCGLVLRPAADAIVILDA